MNQSLEALNAARERARRRALGLVVVVAGLCLFMLAYLMLSTGAVLVVQPADAKPRSQLSEGLGFIYGNRVFSLSREVGLLIEADGFEPARLSANLADARGVITVSLRSLPARLRINTVPVSSDTRLLLDGVSLARGPVYEGELSAGEYQLRVENPAMDTVSQALVLERDGDHHLEIKLPLHLTRVTVSSKPAGAGIIIDGAAQGAAPLTASLAPGTHTVEAKLPGYQLYRANFTTARALDELALVVPLVPNPAMLRVSVTPADALLLVDGKEYPASATVAVPSGRQVQLIVTRRGYKPHVTSVSLGVDQQHAMTVKLEPELGTLDLRSRPAASVYIDGKNLGQTPLVLKRLAVPQTVSLRAPGYRSHEQTLTPSASKTRVLDVDLLTERAARIAEAKPVFTNSLGIRLRLFSPGKLQMGARRSDPGQRANEVIREVELSRYFYAAENLVSNAQFGRYRGTGGNQMPVVDVSWEEVARFCNWLSAREGLAPVYSFKGQQYSGLNPRADGYRLLTEAEWVWLARYGRYTRSPRFSWGDTMPVPEQAGNFADEAATGQVDVYIPRYMDNYAKLAPVGSFEANRNGLYDMGGNAREWVQDFYELLPLVVPTSDVDRLGPASGNAHVVRGSGWRSASMSDLRLTARSQASEGADDIGFRVGRWLGGD